MYGIGASAVQNFNAGGVGYFVKIVFGLQIILTCPGLYISLRAFNNNYSLPENLFIGFIINVLTYPAIIILANIIGISVTANFLVSAIALLTAACAIFWINSSRTAPSRDEIKATSLKLAVAILCLLTVLLIFPRNVLTPLDRYASADSFTQMVNGLNEYGNAQSLKTDNIERDGDNTYDQRASQNATWTYTNNTSSTQEFILRLLTTCNEHQLSINRNGTQGDASNSKAPLNTDEFLVATSIYLPVDFGVDFINREFPDRNRIITSETFALSPGVNTIEFKCLDNKVDFRIIDLSLMNDADLRSTIQTAFLIKDEPEVGDAQEAYLESKYALDEINWINPPLLYPIYRSMLEILGMSFTSIALLELFAFSLVLMNLSKVSAHSNLAPSTHSSIISSLVVINYIIAITSLPLLHSAAGVFLSVFLAAIWFLWTRKFVAAALAIILMCLMRYEGAVLAVLSLFAFFTVGHHPIRFSTRRIILLGLVAIGAVGMLVVWIWGPGLFKPEALAERVSMFQLMNLSPMRILSYLQWAFILTCGMPVFWFLIKKTDRLSLYYLIIAALYLCFLITLNYLRPYHFGPFVVAATGAGSRAIASVDDTTMRKLGIIVFLMLACAAYYLVFYHLPLILY